MSEAVMTLPAGWTEIDDDVEGRNLRHAEARYRLPGEKEARRVVVATLKTSDAALLASINEAIASIDDQGGEVLA